MDRIGVFGEKGNGGSSLDTDLSKSNNLNLWNDCVDI